MKWVMKDPKAGDMIRVELGTIYHFGIYVSDDEVIQFGLAPSRRLTLRDSEVEVLSSDIDAFLAGGFLEVCEFDRKERKKHRSPKEVVSYARSKLGTKGYNILYNNCEHFANECISGEHICHQADDVRAMFRTMPVVDVYIATLPGEDIKEPLSCSLRQKELEGISNPNVKREKYYVWKLLGYALQRSFGLKIEDLTFQKTDEGRYFTDKAEFSLSHSKGALVVAVSRGAVGVDIEEKSTGFREGMAERVMTQTEYEAYTKLPEKAKHGFFVELWTAKEALFKESKGVSFVPDKWDTNKGTYRSFEKTIDGKVYILSVATATPEKIRFFENVKF